MGTGADKLITAAAEGGMEWHPNHLVMQAKNFWPQLEVPGIREPRVD